MSFEGLQQSYMHVPKTAQHGDCPLPYRPDPDQTMSYGRCDRHFHKYNGLKSEKTKLHSEC
jgi:hypothetical protein